MLNMSEKMFLNAEEYEKYLVLYIPYHVRDIFYFVLVNLGICEIGLHILIYLIPQEEYIFKRMVVRKKQAFSFKEYF